MRHHNKVHEQLRRAGALNKLHTDSSLRRAAAERSAGVMTRDERYTYDG